MVKFVLMYVVSHIIKIRLHVQILYEHAFTHLCSCISVVCSHHCMLFVTAFWHVIRDGTVIASMWIIAWIADLFETFWCKVACDYWKWHLNLKTTHSYCCSQVHFHVCRQNTQTTNHHLCQQYELTPSLHPSPSCGFCLKPLQHAPKLFGVPEWTVLSKLQAP